MARPTKHNVDYFAHDCDMRNDLKIQALRRKFSHKGYSIWNMILEVLGNEEYFEYEWTELNKELLSADFNLDVEEIDEIVDYCIKVELLTIEKNFLTCNTFTKRLEETVLVKRKDYCRNNAKRIQSKIVNEELTNEKLVITELTIDNCSLSKINRQSKVKESKVKEIKEKEKESKVKEIKEKQIKPLTDNTKNNAVMGKKSFMEIFYENPNTSVNDYLKN